MVDQVTNNPNFATSRTAASVHERSSLQETPAGDFVILTVEGYAPEASFSQYCRTCQQILQSLLWTSMA